MNNISLVTTSLEYYDSNNEKYGSLFKNITYIKFIVEEESQHNIIVYYDSDKKEVFRSRYEIIGLYNSNTNTWTWAWAIPIFKKNNTNIVRKIWNYGAVLSPKEQYLKTELITSRFRVADPIQLDIHVALASYLSKTPVVYKMYNYMQDIGDLDIDGYLNIKKETKDNYTLYYMFLLDAAGMEDK